MPATTLNNINAAFARENLPYEIVKGNGYFYFAPLDCAPLDVAEVPSVYSCQLRAMTVAEYVDHVKEAYSPPMRLGLVQVGRRALKVKGFA